MPAAQPMPSEMKAGAATAARTRTLADSLLLRDCLSLGALTATRPTARERLDAAIGPELTRRLLAGLTARGRR